MKYVRINFSDQREGMSSGQEYQLRYIIDRESINPHEICPHANANTELLYCRSGQYLYRFGSIEIAVRPGDLLIVKAGAEHSLRSNSPEDAERIIVGVSGLAMYDPGKGVNMDYFMVRDRPEIGCALELMLKEAQTKEQSYEECCRHLLELILIQVRRFAQSNMLTTVENVDCHCSADLICLAVKKYIEENYTCNITLDMMANQAAVSKYYMSHKFQKKYGISPVRYLQKVRLKESCSILSSTTYGVSSVAHMVGFRSVSYFTQCFREEFNMTPSEYRLQIRNSSDLH